MAVIGTEQDTPRGWGGGGEVAKIGGDDEVIPVQRALGDLNGADHCGGDDEGSSGDGDAGGVGFPTAAAFVACVRWGGSVR